MSLSYLRDNIVKALNERAANAAQRAIDMRIRPASDHVPAMTADEYALYSVDVLSESRAYHNAMHIVLAEYKKMIEPEKIVEITEPVKKKGSMY